MHLLACSYHPFGEYFTLVREVSVNFKLDQFICRNMKHISASSIIIFHKKNVHDHIKDGVKGYFKSKLVNVKNTQSHLLYEITLISRNIKNPKNSKISGGGWVDLSMLQLICMFAFLNNSQNTASLCFIQPLVLP